MLGSGESRLHAVGRIMVIAFCLIVGNQAVLSAHEGPPFPILMDQPAAGHVVSVWADPDIGEAKFFVIVESPAGSPPSEPPGVVMWVEPVSGRLDRVTCQAAQQPLRNQIQFEARPYFDQRDMWNVGFRITTADGKSEELTTQIESTPPGFGRWDLAIYLFPFLLLGGMWILAMKRRSRMHYDGASQQPPVSAGNHAG